MVEQIWLYLFADAQRETDVAVHFSDMYVTHHPTDVTPTFNNLPEFTRCVHRDLSCGLHTPVARRFLCKPGKRSEVLTPSQMHQSQKARPFNQTRRPVQTPRSSPPSHGSFLAESTPTASANRFSGHFTSHPGHPGWLVTPENGEVLREYKIYQTTACRRHHAGDRHASAGRTHPLIKKTENSIYATEDRIDDLRDGRADCEDRTCRDEIADEIDFLSDTLDQLRRDFRDMRVEYRDDYDAYTRLQSEADAVARKIDRQIEDIDRKFVLATDIRESIQNSYERYGRLEGGFANIAYDSKWQANVQTLRRANPNFVVTPIETNDVHVSVALIGGIGTDEYTSQGTRC